MPGDPNRLAMNELGSSTSAAFRETAGAAMHVLAAPGTSLACPSWAALIAIADQGRVANGGKTSNRTANPRQALQVISN